MAVNHCASFAGPGQSVLLPDLFASVMRGDEVANPHYDKVKPEADAWIVRVLNLDARMAKRNAKADLAYLSALWVPSADEDGLRLMADWNHWVFVFDDQFDEGHLKADPMAAAEEIVRSLAILDDTHSVVSAEENPIRHVFQETWRRFRARSSPALQSRFKRLHSEYMLGCLKQVHWQARGESGSGYPNLTVEQYLDYRRGSVGTYPAFAVVECATGVDLPEWIMDHPTIKICEEVMTDIVILGNDILSMRKDLKYGVEHNMVTRLRAHGMTMQEALDQVGEMLDECYARWYETLEQMPSWGSEALDQQVLRLLDGYRNVALGTLYWSFKSGRYLGDDGPQVRETRILKLPMLDGPLPPPLAPTPIPTSSPKEREPSTATTDESENLKPPARRPTNSGWPLSRVFSWLSSLKRLLRQVNNN